MNKIYTVPTLEQYGFIFERGYDLSTTIGGWESGSESSGSAE